MPRFCRAAVLMASWRERRSACGFATSLSVSAATGAVVRCTRVCAAGGVVVVVVCADRPAAVISRVKIVVNRPTAVMQVLLDTPLLRKDRVDVSREPRRDSRRALYGKDTPATSRLRRRPGRTG